VTIHQFTSNDAPHLGVMRFFGQHVGVQIRLKPYDRALMVRIDDEEGTASLLVETYIVREGARKTTFLKRGKRLYGFKMTAGGGYRPVGEPMVIWDDDFTITEEVPWGSSQTTRERNEKREWEGMAYRVGAPRAPMDNAARVAEGHTTDAMARHWR
jgi:hypothetical protein